MFLSQVAEDKIPHFNQRVRYEDAALEFCARNKIYIVEDKRQKYGKLKFYKGYVFLLINPKLSRGMKLWVLWHEIGHFIFHAPASSNFSMSTKRKNDREANYVAALALIPKDVIEMLTPGEIQDEYGLPMELIQIRLDIRRKENI